MKVNAKKLMDSPMGKAIKELSKRMKEEGLPPAKFNVVGGFALMAAGIRDEKTITDIDYVGPNNSHLLNQLIDEVGHEHHMPKGWINNDVLLSGSSLEDLEFATGTLHFHPAIKTSELTIDVLDPKDVLRMKLIAVDTSLIGVAQDKAEFTRIKDLPDIKAIVDHLKTDIPTAIEENEFYIVCPHTKDVLETYMKDGLDAADKYAKTLFEKDKALKKSNITQRRSDEFADLYGGSVPDDDDFNYHDPDDDFSGYGDINNPFGDYDDEGSYYDS